MRLIFLLIIGIQTLVASSFFTLKTTSKANVRECQNVSCKKTGSIKKGQVFKTKKFEDWYYIENRFYKGWVSPLVLKVLSKPSEKVVIKKTKFKNKVIENKIKKLSKIVVLDKKPHIDEKIIPAYADKTIDNNSIGQMSIIWIMVFTLFMIGVTGGFISYLLFGRKRY